MAARVRHPWMRWCAGVYPVITLAAIVFTGNHYVLDAVGGYAALGLGYLVARAVTRSGRRPARPEAPAVTTGDEPVLVSSAAP